MNQEQNDPRNVTWGCGHAYRVNAPDFNPSTDASWCATRKCPACMRTQVDANYRKAKRAAKANR